MDTNDKGYWIQLLAVEIIIFENRYLWKELVGRVAAQARNNSWVVNIKLGLF